MKTISENVTTMEGVIPNLQDRIAYNHFENGVQPIVFQDAIIKKMDLTPPPPPAVPIITAPQINNITPQVQYTQESQSTIPVLDLKPIDPYSLYYTEPSSDPSSDENIKNNVKILSNYIRLHADLLIKNKDFWIDRNIINALEILKLRILNEKKVLDEFSKFIREFNRSNDETKKLEFLNIDTEREGYSISFIFIDNITYHTLIILGTDKIQYDIGQDGKKYCINPIQFSTLAL